MRRIVTAIILAIFTILILTLPSFATLSAPDSISVISAQVVRNTVVQGDFMVIFEGDIEWSTLPTTPTAATSFAFYLYDGTTKLASQTPFVLYNAGYGKFAGGFYFNNLRAPDWEGAYQIYINGLAPAFGTPLPTYNYTLQVADYSTFTSAADNQSLAATYVMGIAQDLETTYSLDLWTTSDRGNVLTAAGEAYFRGTVPGINAIAPSLFYTQAYLSNGDEIGYNQNLGNQYKNRLQNTDIMTGFNRLGTLIGTTGQTVADILAILAALALVVWTAWKGWGVDPGMIGGSIILTAAAVLLGDAMLTIRLVMGLLVGIVLFYQLYLKRA